MKNSKLFLYICLVLLVIESILTVAQANLTLPSWARTANWCLLILSIIFLALYFLFGKKEK